MKHPLFLALLSLLLLSPILPAQATMDCYVDPVYEHTWSAKITSAVWMRDQACMEGSTIFATIPQNATVTIVGSTDGWYYVEWNGGRGWMGTRLASITSQTSDGKTWSSYQEYMQANPSRRTTTAPTPTPAVRTDSALTYRMRGYILLDVQSHGEAWYVNPTNSKRSYMKDGATAYQMMRSFGLGVSEADYVRLETGDLTFRTKLRGRIVVRPQARGEAYYIHPKTLSVNYLKDGAAAYQVMRELGQGISSADLARIAQ